MERERIEIENMKKEEMKAKTKNMFLIDTGSIDNKK